MGANCYSAKNNEGFLCWGGREKKSGTALSSISDEQLKEYLNLEGDFPDTEELEMWDVSMKPREVAQILSFAFQPDDSLYILSRMSKSSVSFLSKNRIDIIEVLRESDKKL